MTLFRREQPLINRFLRILIFSDVILISAFGLVTPIFAIFITEQIAGGTLTVVGFAQTIFLATKSVLQIFVARRIDRRLGERDDYYFMIVGSFLFAAVPILYVFARTPWDIYAAQFLFGIAAALNFPSWMALFTRHIDKRKEGLEWALHNTSFSLGMAVTASLGALIAQRFGFDILFYIVAAAIVVGSFALVLVYREVLDGDRRRGII